MSTKFRNRRKLSSMVITYNTKRRVKRKRQIQSEDAISDIQKEAQRVCNFCLSGEDCEIDFGMFLGKEDVTVHYFCLLLSSGLCQNTKPNDKKSILGFLLTDIKKEIKRGNRLKCCFCHEKGATIGCCIGSCKKAFHLNCGRQNGTLHQFFDSFQSYCPEHRLQQDVKAKLQLQKAGSHICPICLISVNSAKFPHSLVAPCCVRSHFHRKCLQQYAISAGKHYFKCPLCNCVKEFQSEMQKFGVYIPDQDASWEREPNAFHDLLERYDTCDALVCTCPQGKNFDADSGDYELFLCGWCGSAGSHLACGALIEKDDVLLCKDCAEIAEDIEKKSKKRKSCIAATSQQSLTVSGTSTRRRVGRPSRNSKLPSAGSSYSQLKPSVESKLLNSWITVSLSRIDSLVSLSEGRINVSDVPELISTQQDISNNARQSPTEELLPSLYFMGGQLSPKLVFDDPPSLSPPRDLDACNNCHLEQVTPSKENDQLAKMNPEIELKHTELQANSEEVKKQNCLKECDTNIMHLNWDGTQPSIKSLKRPSHTNDSPKLLSLTQTKIFEFFKSV